jgi:hypothetical protein
MLGSVGIRAEAWLASPDLAIAVVLESYPWAYAADHAIVVDPAGYPKLRANSNLLHTDCLGAASQVDHIIGILRPVGGHDDIAFDLLAWSYRLIQQAIKAVFVDVSGCRADRVLGTVTCQV